MAYGDYINAGTISVSNGGTTVIGSGTSWASGPTPVFPGDTIYAGGQVNIVASVASNTSLEVRLSWAGTTLSGAVYTICLDAPSRQAAAKSSTAVNDLISRMQVLESSLYQPKVKTLGSNTPASTPAENDIHVAGTAPTGAWSGYANNYLTWTGGGWLPQSPQLGDAALIEATADLSIWDGAAWVTRPYTGGAIRYDAAQSLTAAQKTQALGNISNRLVSFHSTNYTAGLTDLDRLLVYTGSSAGTFSLPSPSVAYNGWGLSVYNNGSGNLTLSTGGLANIVVVGSTNTTVVLAPSQSLQILSNGDDYFAVGGDYTPQITTAISGAIRRPDGVLEQWGVFTSHATIGAGVGVTFPVAYTQIQTILLTPISATPAQTAVTYNNTSMAAVSSLASTVHFWRTWGK